MDLQGLIKMVQVTVTIETIVEVDMEDLIHNTLSEYLQENTADLLNDFEIIEIQE